ncbi:MAG: adenylate kinase [Longimicrobiales bacterium]
MNVILLGPPGVGKGTQGVLLAEGKSWKHIATGDILRANRREGTRLGQEAQKYMDAGELVPDELIVAMVKETLAAMPAEEGVVFDGFPRTVPQAEALDLVLEELDRRVDRVVVLEADDDVLVKRIAGRRSCPECGSVFNIYANAPAREGVCDKCTGALVHRADDNPETVRNRLDVYKAQTEPLIRFYEGREGVVVRIPGEGGVDEIQLGIRAAL